MLEQLRRKRATLKEEEARLARLVISGKITEETYDQLRSEWQEKMLNLHLRIEEMEVDVSQYVDELEIALALMTDISKLFDRLEEKQKTMVLQTVIERICINTNGENLVCELHSPFAYLSSINSSFISQSIQALPVERTVPFLGELRLDKKNILVLSQR